MKKRRNKAYRPKTKNWGASIRAMHLASTETQSADVHLFLSGRAYAALDKLTAGTFTTSEYSDIFKLTIFAGELFAQTYSSLSDESRDAISARAGDLKAASEAVSRIGDRYLKTDRFGATGNELSDIRKAFILMDDLIGFATIGETTRAMRSADAITAKLQESLNVSEPLTNPHPDRPGLHEGSRA